MDKVILLGLTCFVVLGLFNAQAYEKKIVFKKKICATQSARVPSMVTKRTSEKWITVWIHGVSLFQPNTYNLGLWPAHTFVENKSLFAIGKDLIESDPEQFSEDNLLMYSWAGTFDYDECERAAERLYHSLLKAIDEYADLNGFRPKVRIITFSYGGNIALSLPLFKKGNKKLVVDELVLLAWPVQHGVQFRAQDAMFKKVFNVYSSLDMVQIFDPQGFCYKVAHADRSVCKAGKAPLFTSRKISRGRNILQAKVRFFGP